MDYALHLLIIAAIYANLSVSLQLMIGYSGLFSVAQAGVFGLGAYSAVLVEKMLHVPVGLGPMVGAIAGGVACFVGSFLFSRLRREEFFLASLALQIGLVAVFNNCEALTGGALGLSEIRPFHTSPFLNLVLAIAVSAVLLGLTVLVVSRISTAPMGRILRASRDDELATLACGKDVARARRSAFVVCGLLAGAAGAAYASYVTAIDPTSFSLTESILLVSIVVVGGSGRIRSTIAAACLLIMLPEALRFLPLPSVAAQQLRQILFGVAFLLVVRYRSGGLLSNERLPAVPKHAVKEVTSDA